MDYTTLPLFIAAVFMLAILPGPGVLITVASALNGGLRRALFTISGIVLGDIVFILLVTLGLKIIAQHLTVVFIAIKYLGSAYLIWLGLSLLFSKSSSAVAQAKPAPKKSALSDVITGLIITLSNPKAILFYMSFLPAFVTIETLKAFDIVLINFIISSIVGLVMFGYAYATVKTHQAAQQSSLATTLGKKIAGGLITLTGGFILTRQ